MKWREERRGEERRGKIKGEKVSGSERRGKIGGEKVS